MTPLPVLNTTAETIPPGGAMEPTGSADTSGRINVQKPTADDSLAVLINGPTPIPPGAAGVGFLPWAGPLAAAIDPALLDADGDLVTPATAFGVESGNWYLVDDRVGFVGQGSVFGGLMPVQAVPGVATAAPAAVYGSTVLSGTVNLTASSGAYSDILSFTPPTTGQYLVSYEISSNLNTATVGNFLAARLLFQSSPYAYSVINYQVVASTYIMSSRSAQAIVSVTAIAPVKLQAMRAFAGALTTTDVVGDNTQHMNTRLDYWRITV